MPFKPRFWKSGKDCSIGGQGGRRVTVIPWGRQPLHENVCSAFKQLHSFSQRQTKIHIALNSYSELNHQLHRARFQTLCTYPGQARINMDDRIHKTCLITPSENCPLCCHLPASTWMPAPLPPPGPLSLPTQGQRSPSPCAYPCSIRVSCLCSQRGDSKQSATLTLCECPCFLMLRYTVFLVFQKHSSEKRWCCYGGCFQ